METAIDTPRPAKRQPCARSRVGNGKVLLAMTDGRSLTARRFQDLFEDICGDLGGRARGKSWWRFLFNQILLFRGVTLFAGNLAAGKVFSGLGPSVAGRRYQL
jgi:hypothetical protein